MLGFFQLFEELFVTHSVFIFVHFSFEDSLTECDTLRELRVIREKRFLAFESLRFNFSVKSFFKQFV